MHTDMPYAGMWEADPTPPREHLVYVSGLPAGSRIGDIVPRLEKAGLGRARVHFRSSGTQVCSQLVPIALWGQVQTTLLAQSYMQRCGSYMGTVRKSGAKVKSYRLPKCLRAG